jgi:hypothetical protein
MVAELVQTESPNCWRLSVEFAEFCEPLRKTIVIADVEVRERQISDVRYSHHEEYTRATSHGIWQPPVHAVHAEAEQLKDELMRAAVLVWDMAIHGPRVASNRE